MLCKHELGCRVARTYPNSCKPNYVITANIAIFYGIDMRSLRINATNQYRYIRHFIIYQVPCYLICDIVLE